MDKNIEVINNTDVVFNIDSKSIFTNTKDIAKVFNKRNVEVMDAVKELVNLKPELSGKFHSTTYVASNGKVNPVLELDRDMFNLVVLGFSGKKALDYKLAFIEAFNKMEQKLLDAKDKEIAKLLAEKKKATLRDDGTTSVRGIAQRTNYTEKQIRDFAVSLGLIQKEIKDTLFWKIKDDKNGLVVSTSEYSTPYFDLKRMTSLLDQEYGDTEEY